MTDHPRSFERAFAAPAEPARVEKRAGERGQVLAMTAILLITVCVLIAVAADMGYFFDYRRQMQTGADGAAMAGADQLRRRASDSEIRSAAFNGASSNGFTNGANAVQVTVNHPPVSGFYAGNDAFVEATISQPRPTIFMGTLGFQSATVSTRAIAGAQDSPNCVYALDPSATHSFNTSGSASVNAACGIVVDSSSGSAMVSSGGGQVTAASIAVTGDAVGCCFSPPPQTGVPPEPDPFAGRAAPQFSGCDYTDLHVNSVTKVLTPGVYCNGIDISGGNSSVTFLPGLYVLNGGGLSVSGGGTVNGRGVTFYNTGSAGYAYKPLGISGGTLGMLAAPTSGPMEGILFFQDRSITSSQTNTVSGGSTLSFEGALYFPTTPLNFSGNSSGSAAYTIIIAKTIDFSGLSNLRAGFGNLQNGNPIKKVALAD